MYSSKQNQPVPAYNIELVDKLVRTLETLRDAPMGLTLQELTGRTGYIKSSIHRTLGSLKWHGSSSRLRVVRIGSASNVCCSPVG
jgi:hypothetical protein